MLTEKLVDLAASRARTDDAIAARIAGLRAVVLAAAPSHLQNTAVQRLYKRLRGLRA